MKPIQNRYDIIHLIDVVDGNPSGDPDFDNAPRTDPETNQGLITDVCIKRKIRNYISVKNDGNGHGSGNEIYISDGAILEDTIDAAIAEVSPKTAADAAPEAVLAKKDKTSKDDKVDSAAKSKKTFAEKVIFDKAVKHMCGRFADVRMFGAVLTRKGSGGGSVTGPVQIGMYRSIDPITVLSHAITRMAVQTRDESNDSSGANRTMGKKHTVPYGMYMGYQSITPHQAKVSGYSDADFTLHLGALQGMFDIDRSAARGVMATRALIVFKHDSPLGSAPWASLEKRVKVTKISAGPPRKFEDYKVEVDTTNLPKGVEIIRVV
jgi:CRISPR-associated protein Csd2